MALATRTLEFELRSEVGGELERGGQPLQDHAADRLGGAVGEPDLALHRVADEARELHGDRVFQPEFGPQRRPINLEPQRIGVEPDRLARKPLRLGDPSERSLANSMTAFFDAWQQLTSDPDRPARSRGYAGDLHRLVEETILPEARRRAWLSRRAARR